MTDPKHDDTDATEHVEVQLLGGTSRTPFPSGPRDERDGDDLEQHLDPNAWSLDPEGRARDAAAYDDEPDGPVGADTWFMKAGDVLAQAYCLSLVRGLDIDAAYLRLDAKPSSVVDPLDLDGLVEEAYDRIDHDGYQLAGAAQVGEWTLVLEPNGFAATSPERKYALSNGTTVITFYEGFSGSNELTLTIDGVEQISFDRYSLPARTGARIADFDADLRAAGFVLDDRDDESGDDIRDDVASAIVVERLTGLKLTVGLLSGLTWRTALLEHP